MQLTNTRTVPALPEVVWAALNDAEVLKDSVPGCESLERVDDSTFKATVATRIGPVSARFNGTMRILDSMPPNGYTLRFEGQGGAAGFANGEARVTLAPADGAATLLTYDVKAQVGGKIAQIGSRLVDAAAAKLSDEFFARFCERLSPPVPALVAETGEIVQVGAGRAPDGTPWIRWISLAIMAAILIYLAARGFR